MAQPRKGFVRNWVESHLESHPGSTAPEIVAAAESDETGPSRASIYRALRPREDSLILESGGCYWLERIGDASLAMDVDIERLLAVLRSKEFTDEAKAEAARQLSRDSGSAEVRSRRVVDLIDLAAREARAIREALLPFVQRAVRAARQPVAGRAYARNLWHVARPLLDPFLPGSGDAATMAWNTVYEVVDTPGFLGDEDALAIGRLSLEVEARAPLPYPSAARAVLRRIGRTERLRYSLYNELLRRLSSAADLEARARLSGLLRELDRSPF